jgi:nucleotidyltransferase/DNA polymerase involved in DNA repair
MFLNFEKDNGLMNEKFSDYERAELLKVKGVGPSVIQRLEEIGIASCESLREYDSTEITSKVADLLGSTCWKNSPQAAKAVDAAIRRADEIILEADKV